MSHCVVTGAAGFVGSHLSQQLLAQGHTVTGIDAFIPYYPRPLKETNLAPLRVHPNFRFFEHDLRTADLVPCVAGADTLFHLAAMAGLLRSWQEFEQYMSCNILATQRLLAAAVEGGVRHVVHCSTSSVYGRYATGDESSPVAPVSPYGITKLAAEQLCLAYAEKDNLPVTVLRLFSVYGPRQRPDMGYNIFIRKILAGETIVIDGDGTDSRSNTYVRDCVDGILLAAAQPELSAGEIFNIGGGEEVTVLNVLEMLGELTGLPVHKTFGPARPGDQRRTMADTTKARVKLGYNPVTRLIDGLAAQVDWQRGDTKPG